MSEEAEQHEEEQEHEVDPAIEEKARQMGWAPKEEFRGDPEKWRPADEFVERGENQLPILRERLEHALKKAGQVDELKKTFEEFRQHHEKTREREYERAKKEIETARLKAVEEGDTQAYMKADMQHKELDEAYKNKPEANPEPEPVIDQALFNQWAAENTWYANDPVMRGAADAIADQLTKDAPTLRDEAFLNALTDKLKEEMPHKFRNQRRERPSPVDGGSPAPGRGKKKTFNDLPEEAKAACKRFENKKLITREQYVKDYFGDEA